MEEQDKFNEAVELLLGRGTTSATQDLASAVKENADSETLLKIAQTIQQRAGGNNG